MESTQARSLIRETFTQPFDKDRFKYFIGNLLNDIDESKAARWTKTYIKDAFKPRVNQFERLATYTDPVGETIDILIVNLAKESSLERARTSLRNFVADYMTTGHGQDKSAVLAAFVSPKESDWRFSFVKLEYEATADESGKVNVSETLTPARRYSFLVGANEHSHTAQKQFLPLLERDDTNPSLQEIEKAFDIEKVTKEFFQRYKDLFENVRDALNKAIKRNSAVKTDFEKKGIETEDFAKKLLGQIVFLYFLQKKGWFGVERGAEWGTGNKQFLRYLFENRAKLRARQERSAHRPVNFFNDVLEHLFYDALARERDDDYYARFDCRIPFLNGGLFEPFFGYDWVNTEILLPDPLFSNTERTKEGDLGSGILDVFDRFNFTVNEAEPLEKEVAVDPEMLGKVFENLLPENLRYKGGTYYTPRPIVSYMCHQSLINYLSTHLPEIPRSGIENFIRIGHAQADFEAGGTDKQKGKFLDESISLNAKRIDKLLEDVTVCDPAIGSGAFPVGMMQEIVRAREALRAVEGMPKLSAYELKRHAIQNSLYGVDIDPGAVEIAKLRLWLSLIVDEEDRNQIQALPNLDYKVMQGNSLLDEFAGVKLLDDDVLAQAFVDRDAELAMINSRINELQDQFFELDCKGARDREMKRRFVKEIEILKQQKKLLVGANGSGNSQSTFQDLHSIARVKLTEIRRLHNELFDTSSVNRKRALRERLEAVEWEFMEAALKERGEDKALAELARHRRDNRRNYFLWKVHFVDVFQDRGGFDIVIANPPYLGEKGNKEIFRPMAQSQWGKKYYKRKMDIFYFFFHLALDLSKDKSTICFISTNYYITADGAKTLRSDFANRATLLGFYDFGEITLFSSAKGQHNSITLLERGRSDHLLNSFKTRHRGEVGEVALTNILRGTDEQTDYWHVPQSELYEAPDFIIRPAGASRRNVTGDAPFSFEKIDKQSFPLSSYAKHVFMGVQTGCDVVTEGLIKAALEKRLITNNLVNKYTVGSGIYVLTKSELDALNLTRTEIGDCVKPFYKNSEIMRYFSPPSHTRYLLYVDSETDISRYPNIEAHLDRFRSLLAAREQAVTEDHNWFWIRGSKRDSYFFRKDAIVVPYRAKSSRFSICHQDIFGAGDVYYISLAQIFPTNIMLGYLNSSLVFFHLRNRGKRKGEILEYYKRPLERIPVHTKLFTHASGGVIADKVDKILEIKRKNLQTNTTDLEVEIDRLVYKLYDLTDDEIAIVEGKS